jgi:hypothetical protein
MIYNSFFVLTSNYFFTRGVGENTPEENEDLNERDDD